MQNGEIANYLTAVSYIVFRRGHLNYSDRKQQSQLDTL